MTEVGSNAYLNKKYDGRLGNIAGTTITKTVKSDTNGVEPRDRTGNSVVFDVSLAVNGGYNGIDDRLSYYEIVKGIIK